MTPYLIGIAGPSGAGKTALAGRVAKELAAPVLSLDHYYRPYDGLPLEERARLNFDEPEALDSGLLAAQVEALARGARIEVPVYDFAIHARLTQTSPLGPAPFIVVEGLFALYWEAVRRQMATRVFVTAGDEVCFTRRLERDVRERARTPESVFEQYRATVRPMAERYVLPTSAFANLVVSGTGLLEDSVRAVLFHVETHAAFARAASA